MPSETKLRIALLLIALAGPALFLIGQGPEFPMDDAYIHLQYARNLAQTGRLEFNPGEFRGLGTTSLLWVVLIAGGIRLGMAAGVVVRMLGIGALLIGALCVFELGRPVFGRESPERGRAGAFVGAALFALSGNMIWFTLSGMETTQFIALGLLTLVCYQRRLWWAVGISLGLAAVCRPEGLGLGPTILALEALRLHAGGQRAWRSWALAALLAAIPVAAWVLYTHHATGHFLPTTFSGKRGFNLGICRHILSMTPALGLWTGSPRVLLLVVWAGYVPMYVFGLSAFPGPAFALLATMGASVSLRLSVIGLVLVSFVALPLLVLGVRQLARFLRASDWRDTAALGTLGVWVWAAVHDAAYLLLLPIPGTGTRYQAINHLLLWWLMALGLFALWPRRRLFVVCACAVIAMAVVDVGYWRSVYVANQDHMRTVRIEAAGYLSHELPQGSRVAAYDIGALRYFGSRTIVDLGGLTDSEFVTYAQEHSVDRYLRDRGADYLAIPGKHSTDREGMFDFWTRLGIGSSPLFGLTEIAVFENERDCWQRGCEATGNYQPSVRVYRIDWRKRAL